MLTEKWKGYNTVQAKRIHKKVTNSALRLEDNKGSFAEEVTVVLDFEG